MKNSLIILALLVSLLPSYTSAKEKKQNNHHTIVKKEIHHRHNKFMKKQVKNHKLIGIASYYGSQFNGRRTASGEIFNKNAMTAAHRTIPFNSKVRVTNLKNNKSVVVKITDRGPWVKNRIMDLSKGAAKSIGIDGIQKVSLDVIG